jgi:L-alanine-DL-glutamate epimerase-like enolase superfamily enzyme
VKPSADVLREQLGAAVVSRLEELRALGEGELAERTREVALQAADVAARRIAGEDTSRLEHALRARVELLEAAGAIAAASAVHGAIRDTLGLAVEAAFAALVRR